MILNLLYIAFSLMLLGSALMVVVLHDPIKNALFLVLCFFSATGLWLLLNAEFLALILILVYVGAVMTLFLFVIMTINVDIQQLKHSFRRYYLLMGLLITALLAFLLVYVLVTTHSPFASLLSNPSPANNQANVNLLGDVLYTQYALPFEIAAVILLVAMIAAISLTLYEPIRRKQQVIDSQVKVRREDRVRLVK